MDTSYFHILTEAFCVTQQHLAFADVRIKQSRFLNYAMFRACQCNDSSYVCFQVLPVLHRRRAELHCHAADVTSCEPDFLVRLDAFNAIPNDPSFGLQYDMVATQVQKVWQTGNFGSANVKVCVVSTENKHSQLAMSAFASEMACAECGILGYPNKMS